MKDSKLVKVLRSFNKIEFKQFGKFVSSPFFSGGRNVKPLYSVLKKFYPDFNSRGFSKENILNELSKSGHKISSALLKTLMSEMYKLAEEFMTYQEMKNDTGLSTYFFARNCGKRNLFVIGENKIFNTAKNLEKEKVSQKFYFNYYYNQIQLSYFYELSNKFIKSFDVYDHSSEIFIHNFLSTASRLVFGMTVIKNGFKLDNKDNLLLVFLNSIELEKFYKQLKQNNDTYSTASRIYLLVILVFMNYNNNDKTYYFKFKKELFRNISIFSDFEKGFLVHTLSIYSNDFIKGTTYMEFAKESFEIINFKLKNNLYKPLREGNPFPMDSFLSYVHIGFILKKLEWLKNYKTKYIEEVPKEFINTCDTLSNAFISFLEGNYVKCLVEINNLNKLILPVLFPIKRLHLMTLYELDYINEAYYALDAFKSFLKQNSGVAASFLSSSNDFVKFYSILLRIKDKEIKMIRKEIIEEVKNSETKNQEWLVEKLEELM